MLSSHTLADNFSVLVDENLGLGSGSVETASGHGKQASVGLAKSLFGGEESSGQHLIFLYNKL